MSTVDTFPQFALLPAELRILVWGSACRASRTRLTLVKRYWKEHFQRVVIRQDWHEYVLEQQRQRLAILGVNIEARLEALKHFDLLSQHDASFALPLDRAERSTSHSQFTFAIDWHHDVFHLAIYFWYKPEDPLELTNFDHKIRCLVFNPRSWNVDNTLLKSREWIEKLLGRFSALELLVLELRGPVDGTESLPELDMHAGGITDQCSFLPLTNSWGNLDLPYENPSPGDVEVVRKIVRELRPAATVEAVAESKWLGLVQPVDG
ncbi:hypothetical protein GGR57DRAFT_458290 [Xylariaceae sp. FL1272]|nr:hypothetical protein GGR57DRAFT_458290 [Xylariaceae sp. FL1272]